MQSARTEDRQIGSIKKVAGLILLSLLCGILLVYAAASGSSDETLLNSGDLLILGIILGIILLGLCSVLFFLKAASHANEREMAAQIELRRMNRRLQLAESILRAEPQVLIFWDYSQAAHVAVNTLDERFEIPDHPDQVLSFGNWIDQDSRENLNAHLSKLFDNGEPFNLTVKTLTGHHLEADGRAAGGRLVLKVRDLAGDRLDLARMQDRNSRLGSDIAAKRKLLDAIPIPIWLRREEGQLEWVNTAYTKAVEASDPDEVVRKQIELLESRQRNSISEALKKGEKFQERLQTIISGERRSYDVIVLPLAKSSAGIALDVDAIETAKGELDRHIEAHTRTLDHVSTAIAIFGPDRRLTFFNQPYLDLWGLDAAWLETGPRDSEILDRLRNMRLLPEQADYRSWRDKHLDSYQSNDPKEDWWHLPDGRSVYVVAEQSPDGGVTYLYEDATERLALESRYNSLIRVQRETLDNLQEGVALFATNGKLTLYNRAFASIWKLSTEELEQGPHIDEIIRQCRILHDDGSSWIELKRAVTSIDDKRRPVEGQLNRSDNSTIAYACLPLPNGSTLLTYVDITDSKRVERMLIERNEALEAAARLKNDFIQSISYELRTPLTNIIGFSEFLSSPEIGPLNHRQHEYLSYIRASSATLLAIINDILDLATIDAGSLQLKLAPVNVRDVIRSAAMGISERLTRNSIGLDIRVDKTAEELVADEKRVTQVLYNLLSNAIGFSAPGSRVLLLCQREENMIAFTVVDQGQGIPEDYQKLVFERFESRSHGSKHRGAGLGLSIVKSLVELHGGEVILRSKSGAGTSITVRFPTRGLHKGLENKSGAGPKIEFLPSDQNVIDADQNPEQRKVASV